MYLYLRTEDRANRLGEASASSEDLLSLIKMPGHPTKPYYFPLIDRGSRTGEPLSSFWRSSNIPGSWSPGSIARQRVASWLASPNGGYAMPADHAGRALEGMLYGERVSALALGAYFLRNDGFVLSGDIGPSDVTAGFRVKFDYPEETEDEFRSLFTDSVPDDVDFDWFEPAPIAPEADDEEPNDA